MYFIIYYIIAVVPLTCAGSNALGPRVANRRVAFVSAVLEPSAASSTAAPLLGFLDSAACGACRGTGVGGGGGGRDTT